MREQSAPHFLFKRKEVISMKAVVNGKIVFADNLLENGAVVFDERIIGINEVRENCETIDAEGGYVLPGFVDVHIHGYKGFDVSDAEESSVIAMSRLLPENGVTSWCPTTMTVAKEYIQKALDIIGKLKNKTENGAVVLGANVEGPFINPQKKGAQPEEYILEPDAGFVIANKDKISLITVAPEEKGGLDFIKTVTENTDISVSVGHTDASYGIASKAISNGANHITHLFNAMPPFNHRAPGVIGAALASDSVYCELIADTFHVHPSIFNIVCKLKGDKLVLITDCMRAGGMSDGEYTLGGQKVNVSGIECRLTDGTIAGSILTMNKAVKNLFESTSLPIWEAVKAASLSPAKSINRDSEIGSIEKGKYADLVIVDKDFNVKKTFVHGKCVYSCN